MLPGGNCTEGPGITQRRSGGSKFNPTDCEAYDCRGTSSLDTKNVVGIMAPNSRGDCRIMQARLLPSPKTKTRVSEGPRPAPRPTDRVGFSLVDMLTPELLDLLNSDLQKEIPRLAKDSDVTATIKNLLLKIPTTHRVINADARRWRPDPGSVHLVVTSPPYWTLKEYPDRPGQLGRVSDYQQFLRGLKTVWSKCYKALVPGGRLVCVVGDVCLSRRRNGGRHTVIPLHAAIQEQCRSIGFDNLSPIIWYKISNLNTEVANGNGRYLGKPYEPNGVVKNDIEFILMLRKPGGYRSPRPEERVLSLIAAPDHERWFRQIWDDIPGASTRNHPAPYPVELADRLVRMFSFAGDIVLDPFNGTGTTQVAAKQSGRNSIGIDVDPDYCNKARARLA